MEQQREHGMWKGSESESESERDKRARSIYTSFKCFSSENIYAFLNESILVLSDYVEGKEKGILFLSYLLFIFYVEVCVFTIETKMQFTKGWLFFMCIVYVQKQQQQQQGDE